MESFLQAFAEPVIKALPKLPMAMLTLLFGYAAMMIIKKVIIGSLLVTKAPKALVQMLMSIINVFLWVLLLALISQSLGLNQIAIALSGSVALIGLAVATGANGLIADVIAGLFLAKDPNFNCGYRIKTNEAEGVIEKIDLRKIRIRDKDGKLHVVPNSAFDKMQWIVLDEG
jgi:small-conductance mechanosensitive channel